MLRRPLLTFSAPPTALPFTFADLLITAGARPRVSARGQSSGCCCHRTPRACRIAAAAACPHDHPASSPRPCSVCSRARARQFKGGSPASRRRSSPHTELADMFLVEPERGAFAASVPSASCGSSLAAACAWSRSIASSTSSPSRRARSGRSAPPSPSPDLVGAGRQPRRVRPTPSAPPALRHVASTPTFLRGCGAAVAHDHRRLERHRAAHAPPASIAKIENTSCAPPSSVTARLLPPRRLEMIWRARRRPTPTSTSSSCFAGARRHRSRLR